MHWIAFLCQHCSDLIQATCSIHILFVAHPHIKTDIFTIQSADSLGQPASCRTADFFDQFLCRWPCWPNYRSRIWPFGSIWKKFHWWNNGERIEGWTSIDCKALIKPVSIAGTDNHLAPLKTPLFGVNSFSLGPIQSILLCLLLPNDIFHP